MKPLRIFSVITLAMLQLARAEDYDVVIYGGTSAAVIAAVQAKKMGKSVVIVSPDKHLGGLSSGGLGFTDTGNKAVTPISPPSGPAWAGVAQRRLPHRLFQGPPAESKVLAAMTTSSHD
jgi:NADPH-dependent 2,4-dienoyl-CoA reductase/sulfur reductase-like enzyme